MTPLIRRYVEARLFEWVMAIGMIGLGIEIIIFPDVVHAASFMLLAAIFPKLSIDIFLIFFGSLRIAALIANGRSLVYGPRVRAIGALAGATLWAQFDLSIIYVSRDGTAPPAAMAFWFVFIFGELYSAYRAAGDGRGGA
jgi:hypothetical protein